MLKVLLVVEQCNPEWPSVPLVGYRYFKAIRELADVTLVTTGENKANIQKNDDYEKIVYIGASTLSMGYYKFIQRLVKNNRFTIWPLFHVLRYPFYEEFNYSVYEKFKPDILEGKYDLVHVLTPMEPRYPFKVIKACKKTPSVIGPVNGGVPFPPGFSDRARKEYAYLNFLRAFGRRLLPGYRETYQKATRILAGSTYTLNSLKEMFNIPDDRISLFYENGISDNFWAKRNRKGDSDDLINLLFVGRLVPYKCADLVLEAIYRLDETLKEKLRFTVVGDGPEKKVLESRTQALGLNKLVHFTGWVNQQETLQFYSKADIFCFPSIREYGGAVVLEAMACGLPCIVVNNGGIGEYVTEETGFKIEPLSGEYLIKELSDKIRLLVEDETLRKRMSEKAIERVREFTWSQKAEKILEIYHELVGKPIVIQDELLGVKK